MKRTSSTLALATISLLSSGCLAGPHQLQRSMDDFDHELYVENPLLNGVLWVVPVIPIGHFVAALGDAFVFDAYHFWAKDVWRGEGASFDHFRPEDPTYQVGSLAYGAPLAVETSRDDPVVED